jgi:hypothetical protein
MVPSFSDMLAASRNVNINTLRLLSLTFLIASLTPMGSIYVLFFSTWGGTGTITEDPNNNLAGQHGVTNGENAAWSSSSSQCSHDTAATTTAAGSLYHWIGPPDSMPWDIASTTPNNDIYLPHRHWTAVIAWMLSLVFGIVIPMILYVFSCIRSRRLRQEREENHLAYQMRRRRSRIEKCLARYSKVRYFAFVALGFLPLTLYVRY